MTLNFLKRGLIGRPLCTLMAAALYCAAVLPIAPTNVAHADTAYRQSLIDSIDDYCAREKAGYDGLYGLIAGIVGTWIQPTKDLSKDMADRLRQDAMQDAFLRVWRHCKTLTPFDHERTVRAYLSLVAQSAAVDALRKSNREVPVRDIEKFEGVAAADDGDDVAMSARALLASRTLLATATPELRAFIGLTIYDGLSEVLAAKIIGQPATTLRSQRDRFDDRRKAVMMALTADNLEEEKKAWQDSGIGPVPVPKDPMSVLLESDIAYTDFVPSEKINDYSRIMQANGQSAWVRAPMIDLGKALEDGRLKGVRFSSLGNYQGRAFKMTVPINQVFQNAQFAVPTPFIIEPDGFDDAIERDGAVRTVNGVQKSDKVPQRMVIASAVPLGVNAAGEAEYALDGYCVDEHFLPPERGSTYNWSKAHQNIVSNNVKDVLRAPSQSALEKSKCVWAAVAGKLSPGMCL